MSESKNCRFVKNKINITMDIIKKSLNLKGTLISTDKALVMGILNLSPDSFFDGGRYNFPDSVQIQIEKMIEEQVDIIDIGAMSTRPGANIIEEEEEWERLKPILKIMKTRYSETFFSVDTIRAGIAEKAYCDFGAAMINDVSAGEFDKKMFEIIAKHQIPYVIMHMRGTPKTMQNNTNYQNLTQEIVSYFSKKLNNLNGLGINDVIIDPGFGFSKTIDQNYLLLNELEEFKIFENLLLVGLSRKSMVWKYLEISPDESLYATQVLNSFAVSKGANIIRVHDVKPAKHLVELYSKIQKCNMKNKSS